MSITMDRPKWTDLDEQSLSKQPMLPQAMAQLIVSQSQRFGGRALVETMLNERRLQNRHFMRIARRAEITDGIKESRLFLSPNNELGFVRGAGRLVHGGSKRPPRRLKRIENKIGNRHFRIAPRKEE